MQARDLAMENFMKDDVIVSPASLRPEGQEAQNSNPTINVTSFLSAESNTDQHSLLSGTSRSGDKRPSNFQDRSEQQQKRKLAGAGAQKMVRLSDEQENSADERTGLFTDSEIRSYAAVGASSSRASGLGTSDAGSVKNKKPARPEDVVEPQTQRKSWLKKYKEKYGSIELENVGSTARDHLALERTFLAWLRTSLSFASIGIAVTQLFRLNTNIGSGDGEHPAISHLRKVGKPLGATFIAIAIFILFIGFHRYYESQHYIMRGKFPASRGSVFFVALLAFSLSTASLVVIITVGGGSLTSQS